jgi:hypothetical protein
MAVVDGRVRLRRDVDRRLGDLNRFVELTVACEELRADTPPRDRGLEILAPEFFAGPRERIGVGEVPKPEVRLGEECRSLRGGGIRASRAEPVVCTSE